MQRNLTSFPQRLALALALAMTACTADPPVERSSPIPHTTAEPTTAARRPTRRYYLGRIADRCQIYSVDGDDISPSEKTPCPPDLLAGERIRIAGKTCMREGGSPDRVEPVVCPDPLTNREKDDRRDH